MSDSSSKHSSSRKNRHTLRIYSMTSLSPFFSLCSVIDAFHRRSRKAGYRRAGPLLVREEGPLTHSIRFEHFQLPKWPPDESFDSSFRQYLYSHQSRGRHVAAFEIHEKWFVTKADQWWYDGRRRVPDQGRPPLDSQSSMHVFCVEPTYLIRDVYEYIGNQLARIFSPIVPVADRIVATFTSMSAALTPYSFRDAHNMYVIAILLQQKGCLAASRELFQLLLLRPTLSYHQRSKFTQIAEQELGIVGLAGAMPSREQQPIAWRFPEGEFPMWLSTFGCALGFRRPPRTYKGYLRFLEKQRTEASQAGKSIPTVEVSVSDMLHKLQRDDLGPSSYYWILWQTLLGERGGANRS